MAENIKIDLLINAAQSAKTIGETKKALKDLKSEALNLKEGSAAFTRIATAAGELQDKIGDLSATTKYLGDDLKNIKGITGIGEGIAGGFAMASGAAALFGGENKKLEESMVKLQAIMAVIQGMQAIGDVLQKQSAATLFIKNMMTKAAIALGYEEVAVKEAAVVVTGEEVAVTVADTAAKGAKIVATEAEVVATKSATLGQKALNLAMKMNPIGILIALIIAGVSALMLWSNATGKSAEEEKKANAEKKKAADLLKKQNEERDKAAQNIAKESTSYAMLIDRLRLTNAGSKERRDLINQINSTYGATLKNMSDEKSFQDQLNLSVDQYIAFKKDEYKIKTNEEKYTSALKEHTKAQDELNAAVARQKAPKKKLLGIDTTITDALADASNQAIIDKSTAKIKEMDKRMVALTVSTKETSASMKELGFKTEDAMGKGIDKTQEAINKQNELLLASIKTQEDLIRAKGELDKNDKKKLSELQDLKIDIMKDGYKKEMALLEKDVEDKMATRMDADKEEIKGYEDKYEAAVQARMKKDAKGRDAAIKALQDETKITDTLEEEKKRIYASTEEYRITLGDKYNIDATKLEKENDKRQADYAETNNEKLLQSLFEQDQNAINEKYKSRLDGDKKAASEFLAETEKLEKRKNDVRKYWDDLWTGAKSERFYLFDEELTAEAQAELDILQDKLDKQLIKEEDFRKEMDKIYGDDKNLQKVSTVGDVSIPYDETLTNLEALLKLYKAKYGEITEITTDANKEQAKTQEELDAEKLAAKEKFWQDMLELERAGQELMMSIFMNAMAQREYTVNKEYDNKIAKIDEEKLAYDNLQADRTIQQQQEYDIQQGFENQKIEAQKARDIELDKIKKKQFDAQKANDIATIIIDTAIAVSKAVKLSPATFGLPWSAIIATMGGVQAGIVASKQYVPSFAVGGIFSGDGMVRGPGTGTSDSVNAKLSNGEAVINAKSTKMFAPILSVMNQAGGGVAIPHFKGGGIFDMQPGTFKGKTALQISPLGLPHNHSLEMDGLAQAITNIQKSQEQAPVIQVQVEATVSESSITTAQKNKQRLKGRTSF